MNKVERHMDICKNLNKIYEQKNHDYGDSFHDTFVEEGAAMARIRLSDKLNRFKKLSREDSEQKVNDESIRDTLLDLANYAIMTVMEMDILAEEDKRVRLGEELSKMKDEAGVALAQNFVDSGEYFCPICGNKLTFNPKFDKYLCGGCGTMFSLTRKAAVQREDTDPDPCEKCTYPGKATCRSFGGCVDHAEWEKRQMDDMIEWEKQQMGDVDIRPC